MKIEWRGRKVVIVGAARQGLALARYLLQRGARVTLTDKQPAEKLVAARQALADWSAGESINGNGPSLQWVCGGHPLTLLDGMGEDDLLCISGGVSLSVPLVVEARQRGIPLSNDSQIFMEATPCKVVGITGSAGKTTTTTLVGRMAQAAVDGKRGGQGGPYRKVWVGGNIGAPLIAMLDEMQADDLCVMELSSFQLEIMTLSPQVAAILNITPNHLDRHGTMEAYTAAKRRILDFQADQDVAVLGRDDPGAWSLVGRVRGKVLSFGLSDLPEDGAGALYQDGYIYLRPHPPASEVRLLKKDDIALRGEHNLMNVMAACTIAMGAGLPPEAMLAGVSGFHGVPHRLEFIRSWGGADWYNDSIATAPERTMAAIHAFDEPLVLLVGGRDKNLPWDDFAVLACQRVDHLIVFGEASGIIRRAIERSIEMGCGFQEGKAFETSFAETIGLKTVEYCAGLAEAVQAAACTVRPGDVVLLSPGGTSFDEFKDFEERGECFAHWVRELQ
jgi:UDP-N-acetylmuramoylalanine--D-glutamate ligase